MSSGAIIAIGVGVLVVLAVVLIAGAARRRDTGDAIGGLSRETRKRDKSDAPPTPLADEAPATGTAVEKAAAIERREPSTAVVKSTPRRGCAVGAARSRDARRHPAPVPQPRRRDVDELQPRRVRSVGHRLPVAAGLGRVRRQDRRRQARPTSRPPSTRARASVTSPRPACGSRTIRRARSRRRRRCRPTRRRSSRAWRRASSSCTRSACTSAAACRTARRRSGSSARATVRSTTGSARRRAVRRRVASTGSRRRSRATRSPSTPARAASCSVRRSAPTRPVRRPRVRTASSAVAHEGMT